jgi:hypothetical protein
MRPYGLRRNEYDNPFVKKGEYGRYNQTRSKLGYKVECKQIKSRARFEVKQFINNFKDF